MLTKNIRAHLTDVLWLMTCHLTLSLCKMKQQEITFKSDSDINESQNGKVQRSSPAACRQTEGPAGGRAHCHSTPEDTRAPAALKTTVILVKETC